MPLRPEYSLGHSRYNAFLFARVPLARDGTGDDVSVLSALTRLQVDPWHEAARLAKLSPEAASGALAATLARLPELNGTVLDAAATARRIVALLPSGAVPAVPITPEMAAAHHRKTAAGAGAGVGRQKETWATWLFWALLVAAILMMVVRL